MQIFDLKVVESLGLPVEVVDGVPCIVASKLDFRNLTGERSMTITVPNHDALQFRDVLGQLLGVAIRDSRGETVMITNVMLGGGQNVARGLYMPPLTIGQTAITTTLRLVGIQRASATAITIFALPVQNA